MFVFFEKIIKYAFKRTNTTCYANNVVDESVWQGLWSRTSTREAPSLWLILCSQMYEYVSRTCSFSDFVIRIRRFRFSTYSG